MWTRDAPVLRQPCWRTKRRWCTLSRSSRRSSTRRSSNSSPATPTAITTSYHQRYVTCLPLSTTYWSTCANCNRVQNSISKYRIYSTLSHTWCIAICILTEGALTYWTTSMQKRSTLYCCCLDVCFVNDFTSAIRQWGCVHLAKIQLPQDLRPPAIHTFVEVIFLRKQKEVRPFLRNIYLYQDKNLLKK